LRRIEKIVLWLFLRLPIDEKLLKQQHEFFLYGMALFIVGGDFLTMKIISETTEIKVDNLDNLMENFQKTIFKINIQFSQVFSSNSVSNQLKKNR
jgi:hypothetical protein